MLKTLRGKLRSPEPESPHDARASAVADDRTLLERARFYFVLAFLTTLGPFSLDMYLPGLPALGRDLLGTESAVQLTLTACLVGLGVGQLVGGPLSDMIGRRKPLIGALVTYAAASIICALAPTLPALIVARLLQGTAGGVVGVIATAVVRDRYAGRAAARFYSLLFLVTLLSPLLAPVIGGELLLVTSWRGIFIALAAIGILLLGIALVGLRETLPPGSRRVGGIEAGVGTLRRLLVDREFLGYAVPSALATGAIFTYLAASAFVLEDVYHVTPQAYGLLFALNGFALGISTQVNRWLLTRASSQGLFRGGLIGLACGGIAMLLCILFGVPGVFAVVGPVLLIVASNGFVGPNSMALALTPHPDAAGSGAAVLGSLRFAVGGAVGPLVGLFGTTSALPLAASMCGLTAGALLFSLVSRRRLGRQSLDRPLSGRRRTVKVRVRAKVRGTAPISESWLGCRKATVALRRSPVNSGPAIPVNLGPWCRARTW